MCDTLLALPPATAAGTIVFGKNSDRPSDEGQSIVQVPRTRHGAESTVSCTYIEIPQVEETHAVLLSQPDWMWGAEMGANEHGVVIGNEAVWPREALGPPALLGMDLLRLGLERGASAREALDTITTLLARHGQGGACAEGDQGFSYHNSFLIADAREGWVLETAGAVWVAEQVTSGVRNISNGLSIRTDFQLSSEGLVEHAVQRGLHSGHGPLDFAAAFSEGSGEISPGSRDAWARRLLEARAGAVTPEVMMDILRHHESGICMHGGFATTASMVSELAAGEGAHWLTGASHPCQVPFSPVAFPGA